MPEAPPDYDAIEKAEWNENASRVPEELDSRSDRLEKRVASFSGRFGYSETEVREKIRTDPMFAAHFAKEPRRTGLHEKAAARWIDNLDCVLVFETLKKSGQDALYVNSDGKVDVWNNGHPPSKSLDFRWRTGETTFYAMHKYTREGGGNQDSQFKEMRDLLRKFQSCANSSIAFVVIVDGPCYTAKKMAELRNHCRHQPPKSFVVSIPDLPGVLAEYRTDPA